MIATLESFDEMVADAARRAAAGADLATDSARFYMNSLSNANRNQLAAVDHLQQTVLRSVFDLQAATVHLSRSVLDTAAMLNHALFEWAAAAVWPWSPLGPLTEPHPEAVAPTLYAPEADYDATQVGDCVMSALRFQGPMGIIASGLGELDD